MQRWAIWLAFSISSGCHSAGLYGHSTIYEPLSEEEQALVGSTPYDPVMVQRTPTEYKGKPLSLFGVVTSEAQGPGGTTDVTLSVRTLEPRNLCESEDEDSCRVTVSEREHAVVHARLKLRREDAIGEHSVGPQSLIRVVGTLADGTDDDDGQPVIVASYYRHWPRNSYVTTAARTYMRR